MNYEDLSNEQIDELIYDLKHIKTSREIETVNAAAERHNAWVDEQLALKEK